MKPLLSCSLCAVAILTLGCGDEKDRRPRIPATGIVTYNGVPVDGATVCYYPDIGHPGQGGMGTTGPDGTYTIQNPYESEPGLVASTYRVTVAKAGRTAPKKTEEDEIIDAPIRGGGLPGKYADPEHTPLRVTLSEGGAPAELRLEGKK